MRIVAFMLVFIVLFAGISLAKGLEITKLDVHVDYDEAYAYKQQYKRDRDDSMFDIANNSVIKADVFPGSNITFTLKLENTFASGGDELRGTFTRITIEDIDDGSDLEDETNDFALDPGNSELIDMKFKIPVDADAGSYNVLIETEAEGDNNTVYFIATNLKLEIKKLAHDIRITKVELKPISVSCDRKAKISAEIMNLGTSLEEDVSLEFKSQNLGLNSFDKDITLLPSNKDEDLIPYKKTAAIDVPSFFEPGNYRIFVNLYWKNLILFDQKTIDLNVRECNPLPKPSTTQSNKTNNNSEVVIETPETNNEGNDPVVVSKETPFFEDPILVSLFFGGVVVAMLLLALIVIAVLKMFKKI